MRGQRHCAPDALAVQAGIGDPHEPTGGQIRGHRERDRRRHTLVAPCFVERGRVALVNLLIAFVHVETSQELRNRAVVLYRGRAEQPGLVA